MSTPTRVAGAGAVVGVAVVLTALNLRPAVVGVSPLLSRIRDDLGLSAPVAGLVSTASVVCFGLLAPVAPALARRLGLEATVVVGLVTLVAGIAVRFLPQAPWLFVGAVLAGAGIAIGNTLLPAIVKRDFPHRVGPMTGAYSGALNMGAGITAAAVVPIADATGSWRTALGLWVVPAAAAALLWVALRRHWTPRPTAAQLPPAPTTRLLRQPLAWCVTIFFGCQSFGFYATAAWIPTLFTDAGVSSSEAGLLLGYSSVVSFVAALVVPSLLGRRRTQSEGVVAVASVNVLAFIGLILAPAAAPWLWMTLLGLAQGAGLSIGLLLIAVRAPDVHVATRLSAMAQSIGYVLAATGPFLLGVVHDAAGGWGWPIGVTIAILVPMLIAGVLAGRDRVLPDG